MLEDEDRISDDASFEETSAGEEPPEPLTPPMPAEASVDAPEEPPLPPEGEGLFVPGELLETPQEPPLADQELADELLVPAAEGRPEAEPDDAFMRQLLEIGFGPIPGDDEFPGRPQNMSQTAAMIEERMAAMSAREVL